MRIIGNTRDIDGKWMSFEPVNLLLEDIQQLLRIKRKPNKK